MLAYGSRGGSDEPGLSDALASRYVRPSKQTYRKVSPLDSNGAECAWTLGQSSTPGHLSLTSSQH